MQETSDGIINVDISEVADFSFCPKYYDYRQSGMRTLMHEYNRALFSVYYKYLEALKNSSTGIKDVYRQLKTNWGISWIKEKTLAEIEVHSINPHLDSYGKRRRAGALAIEAFGNIMEEPQYPIAVRAMYSVPIIDHKINLVGIWDYIREILVDDEKHIQVVKFEEDVSKMKGGHKHQNSIDIVAMAYAFKKLFDKPFDVIIIDTNTGSIKGKVTKVDICEEEYKELEQTVVSYVKCIKNDIRLISPGIKCNVCEYREACYPEHFKGGKLI